MYTQTTDHKLLCYVIFAYDNCRLTAGLCYELAFVLRDVPVSEIQQCSDVGLELSAVNVQSISVT